MRGKKFFAWMLTAALVAGLFPVPALAAPVAEQFPTLTPGGTYWFDLSGAEIPGEVNFGTAEGGAVPDTALHWVPFTYVGTINAYSRKSEGVSTEDDVMPYDHSLFISDCVITHTVHWYYLSGSGLIFGRSYSSGGVNYTMRAPSVGSGSSAPFYEGTPRSNEWDMILDKRNDYIKNWEKIYTWGQDTSGSGSMHRAVRGHDYSARYWAPSIVTDQDAAVGFRPVLELPAPDALSPGSLKVVAVDLNGGKAGTTETAQDGPVNIVVTSDGSFTAPSGEGLTRPAGNTDSFFRWRGDDGSIYAPGGSVPASVNTLTVLWEPFPPVIQEQPQSQTVMEEETTVFTVTAGGAPAPAYQWQVSQDSGSSWEDIFGATESSCTTGAADMSMDGWQYRCVVSNDAGHVESSAATLAVTAAKAELSCDRLPGLWPFYHCRWMEHPPPREGPAAAGLASRKRGGEGRAGPVRALVLLQ